MVPDWSGRYLRSEFLPAAGKLPHGLVETTMGLALAKPPGVRGASTAAYARNDLGVGRTGLSRASSKNWRILSGSHGRFAP